MMTTSRTVDILDIYILTAHIKYICLNNRILAMSKRKQTLIRARLIVNCCDCTCLWIRQEEGLAGLKPCTGTPCPTRGEGTVPFAPSAEWSALPTSFGCWIIEYTFSDMLPEQTGRRLRPNWGLYLGGKDCTKQAGKDKSWACLNYSDLYRNLQVDLSIFHDSMHHGFLFTPMISFRT